MESKEKVGYFNTESGSILVIDPCYSRDLQLGLTLKSAKNGRWITFIQKENPNERVSELTAHCLDDVVLDEDYVFENTMGVDSGQAGIFDLNRYEDAQQDFDEFYNRCCDKTLSKNGYGILEEGTVCESGYGDGEYNVLVAKNSKGDIIGIKILFIEVDIELDQVNTEDIF